jgi:putative transposase
MRSSRFTPEQVAMALRQAESGTPVSEICRKLEVTENTFYQWKRKFGGLGTPEIRELCYQRLHVLLRREGWSVNRKRVLRLYREEGLALKRTRPKRRRSAVARIAPALAQRVNERWAMDFVHDTLADGRTIRVLTVLDVYTRERVALVAQPVFRGEDVARILSLAGDARELPQTISVDNGTEFTSRSLDHWAYWNKVQLDFSRPGKPIDNAFIESFNSSLRRECLSQHYFAALLYRYSGRSADAGSLEGRLQQHQATAA